MSDGLLSLLVEAKGRPSSFEKNVLGNVRARISALFIGSSASGPNPHSDEASPNAFWGHRGLWAIGPLHLLRLSEFCMAQEAPAATVFWAAPGRKWEAAPAANLRALCVR